MAGSWNQNVNFIQDGERVDASVSGRPDRALSDRTQYLKDRIDAIDSGRALYAFDASVESSVLVGQAVYWNSANQRFEKALAFVGVSSNGILSNNSSSDVVGVVYSKSSSTVADILLAGQATLDISQAVSGSVTAGRYYLSGTEPGFIVKQATGVALPVLVYDGTSQVYMQVQSRDLSESHQHYKVELFTTTAGVHVIPSVGNRHVINDADDSLPGWLPADDPSFNGLAPANAAFGYNLAAHPDLSRLWPPLPESAASLTLFSGTQALGQEVPLGADGLAIINTNGIWWMSDCYGDVPWDVDYTASFSSEPQSSLGYPECPRDLTRKLVLYFSKVKYGNGSTVVTSIRADSTSSPIRVTNLDGNPATSGDIKLSFDSDYQITSTTQQGSLVLKTVDSTNFTQGRVIEGLKASNGSVILTGTHSRADGSDTIYQGIVSVEANIDGVSRYILPQITRLIDVKERYENEIMYLGMSPGIQSSVRYKFKLPSGDAFPSNPKLKLRLWLTGDTLTSNFPTLTVQYRRIPRVTSATAIPTSDTSLSFTTGMNLGVDQYIEKDSAQFTVAESDVVLFTVTRSASDGYLGEIGILDAVAVLSPGS